MVVKGRRGARLVKQARKVGGTSKKNMKKK